MKTVTIKDVARHAKVSISTVSRVLNESGYVSEQTSQRVWRAIEALNYKPNQLARSLTTGRSRTIGLVLPDITNPFFPAVARGVEDAANVNGYTVILCNTDADPEQEKAYVTALREKRVDGFVFTVSGPDASTILGLIEADIPVVVIDRCVEGASVDSVLIYNEQWAYEATMHLIGLGHRAIAYINGPDDLTTSKERYAGYRKALADAGVSFNPALVRTGDFRYPSGHARMRELLASGQEVTAVFAANDMMAIGAMRAIQEWGLRVPEDIAVVGFDDILLASLIKPSLTTISQPAYHMGALAVEMLLERIGGAQGGEARTKICHARLVVRESCGGRREEFGTRNRGVGQP